jgi:hypothetical protein
MAYAVTDPDPATVLLLTEACRRFGRARVRWALRCGRWQRPHPRVVVTHSAALVPAELLQLAVLAGPPGTLLGGLTALALDGLRGFDEDDIHLVVPHSARVGAVPSDVVVHRSLVLEADQVRPAATPPRTRVERSVVDAASWTPWPRRARAIVLASVQQRLTTPARLRETLAARGPVARCGLVRETILDAEGGVHSVPEHDFTRIVVRRGLPRPTRQAVVQRHSGRYYLDARFDPWGVAAEIDGARHRDVWQSEADDDRQNDLVIAGQGLLRFSSYRVRHEPEQVGDVLCRALIAAGWHP